MTVSFICKGYDAWVGFFWDRDKRWLYFLPVPCIGIILKLKPKVAKKKSSKTFKTYTAERTQEWYVLRDLIVKNYSHKEAIKKELKSLGADNLSQLAPIYYDGFKTFLILLD
jgi:hypothetical protein